MLLGVATCGLHLVVNLNDATRGRICTQALYIHAVK